MGNLSWSVGKVRITRVVEHEVALPLSGLLPEATDGGARPAPRLARAPLSPPGRPRDALDPRARRRVRGAAHPGRHLRRRAPDSRLRRPRRRRPPLPRGARGRRLSAASRSTSCCARTCTSTTWAGTRASRTGAGCPSFPNARYLFARAEWEHWSRETRRGFGATLDEAVRPVVDAGLADLVETDHAITREVRLEPSPGHTPGHVCVRIESQRRARAHHRRHDPPPGAVGGARLEDGRRHRPGAGAARRGGGFAASTPTGRLLVIGTHYAPPCAGHVVRAADGYAFRVGP